MKKSLILAGAALLALAACNKSEVVTTETSPKEIAFNAVTKSLTKADPQLTGSTLGTDNNKVRMYVSATTNTANGAVENAAYVEGQRFAYKTETQLWRPVSADASTDQHVYWPLGGSSVDFLAYAYYLNTSTASTATFTGQVTPTWATNKADGMTFTEINLYDNDLDLMYAAANAKQGGAVNGSYKPVDLVFHHAGAVIELNIKSNVAVTINEVKFGNLIKEAKTFADNEYATLDKEGTLFVDNTKNVLTSTWTNVDQGTSTKYASLIAYKGFTDEVLTADTYTDIDNVIVIPQPKLNFIIKYTDSNSKYFYVTAPTPKGNWLAGHKYVYNVNITFYEVEVHESVIDYTTEDSVEIPLS